MAHTVFPPSHFFVQYILLRNRPSTIVASDGKTDLCTVNIISCYDAEACPGRKINKSAGTDTKQYNMASWCDAYYINRLISRFECNLTHITGISDAKQNLTDKFGEMGVLQKGHSLIQWWSGISLTSKQKRTFHSPVS